MKELGAEAGSYLFVVDEDEMSLCYNDPVENILSSIGFGVLGGLVRVLTGFFGRIV